MVIDKERKSHHLSSHHIWPALTASNVGWKRLLVLRYGCLTSSRLHSSALTSFNNLAPRISVDERTVEEAIIGSKQHHHHPNYLVRW